MIIGIDVYVYVQVYGYVNVGMEKKILYVISYGEIYVFVRAPMNSSFFFSNAFIILIVTG